MAGGVREGLGRLYRGFRLVVVNRVGRRGVATTRPRSMRSTIGSIIRPGRPPLSFYYCPFHPGDGPRACPGALTARPGMLREAADRESLDPIQLDDRGSATRCGGGAPRAAGRSCWPVPRTRSGGGPRGDRFPWRGGPRARGRCLTVVQRSDSPRVGRPSPTRRCAGDRRGECYKIGERTGIEVLVFARTSVRSSSRVGAGTLEATALLAELRRTTDDWHREKYGCLLWSHA